MKKGNKSIGGNPKNLFSAVIILFVSASAFAAGYLQNDYGEQAEQLRTDANHHQRVSNELKNTFLRLNEDEFREFDKAVNYQVQAENLVIEFLNVAPILTAEETQSYLDRIGYNYWQMEAALESTWSFLMFYHFEIDEQEDPYVLDVYPELDNHVVEVSKERYFFYPSPITIQDAEEFLSANLVDTGVIRPGEESIIQQIVTSYYMPELLVVLNFDTLTDILIDLILEEMDLADQLTIQATNTEQIGARLAVGVSITTVASILVVAMSNRLENRKMDQQFSQLRADILKDETVIVTGSDPLALVVLILAAIIAVIGLLGPIYLAMPLGI